MTNETITITSADAEKLRELLSNALSSTYRNSAYLTHLRGELERARIVDPDDLPADIVTMHSTVELRDLESGELLTWTLVFPDEADLESGKISVLAPIGTAMLGYRVGDTFTWDTPAGACSMRVERLLYQPVSSGLPSSKRSTRAA